MDVRTAPLNPCSLETIPIPIRLANGQSVWPLLMSCYELTNNNNNISVSNSTPSSSLQSHAATNSTSTNATVISSLSSTETSSVTNPSQSSSKSVSLTGSGGVAPIPKQNRSGHMDVSFIEVPKNIAHTTSPMPLQFDLTPTTLPPAPSKMGDGGGILDGQWSCLPTYISNSNNSNNNNSKSIPTNQNYCFASAHSTGEIQLHSMRVIPPEEYIASNGGSKLVDIQFLGRSSNHTTNTKNAIGSTVPNPLCLSLRWDTPNPYTRSSNDDHSTATTTPKRIVSSYSNGTMAIHDVVTVSSDVDHASTTPLKHVQLIERDRWDAHTMMPTNTPAEVWTAAFVGHASTGSNTTVVWSGGDDMKLKIWDTRSTLRPMLSYHSLFDAGITCISPHPTHDHMVAVGSCTLLFFDFLVK